MPDTYVIAVVDDDLGMREALSEMIEVLAFTSRSYSGGEDLLARLCSDRIDCVITDVRMPGMDGLELQRRLRQIAPELPLIIITSFDDATTRARAMDGGATAFLAKPVNAAEVKRVLCEALGNVAPLTS